MCGYEAIKIQIIDQVEHGDEKGLEECELNWQSHLRYFVENGLEGLVTGSLTTMRSTTLQPLLWKHV